MGKRILNRRSVCDLRGERGCACRPERNCGSVLHCVHMRCISKRRSHDLVLMRLTHSRFARTVIAAARAWPLETARGRSGTSWRVGEVGKHGSLFLFDLTRGLEKARGEARQVEDRWKECPGSRVIHQLSGNQSTAVSLSHYLRCSYCVRRVFW